MKRYVVLSLAVVALAACSKPKPVVLVDSWYDAQMARKACQTAKDWMQANQAALERTSCDTVKYCPEASKRARACTGDDTGGLRSFEAKLVAGFAVNADCRDVELVLIKNPNEPHSGDPNLQWQLTLSYVPGEIVQGWSLTGPGSEYMRGGGVAEDIAPRVCEAMMRHGG